MSRIAMLCGLIVSLWAVVAQAHPIDDYLVLVDQASVNPRQADYVSLRKAYYAVLSAPDDQRRNKMADDIDAAKSAFDAARARGSLDLAETYLKNYLRLTFGSILNQRAAAIFYERERSNPTRAAEHRWIADQMLDAILKLGDGKSPQTAYQATSVREEYLVMERLGLQVRGQALMHDRGHHYDMLRGAPAKQPGGPEQQVYFDISSFF